MQEKTLSSIKQSLTDALSCRLNMLVGCPRQNALQKAQAAEVPWRLVRGNALLHALGFKITIATPTGSFDTYARWEGDSVYVLQFRGGRWKPWWEEDAKTLAAFVQVYTLLDVVGIILLQELEGELTFHVIQPVADPQTLVSGLMAQPEMTRIRRDSQRGRAWCQHCSVRSQCEAMDLQSGDTSDWLKQ